MIQYAEPIGCDQYHRQLQSFCQIADPVLWRDGDFPAADALDKKGTMMALNPSQDVRKIERLFGFDGRALGTRWNGKGNQVEGRVASSMGDEFGILTWNLRIPVALCAGMSVE